MSELTRPADTQPSQQRIPLEVMAKDATLRDHFAAKALQGWLSGPCQGDTLDDYDDKQAAFLEHQECVARTCYGYADAMLKARQS